MGEKKLNGQTAKEWAEEYFECSNCDCCGRGIDHHWIIDTGIGGWFAGCYDQPKVTQIIVLWRSDDSDYRVADDPDPDAERICCVVHAYVSYDMFNDCSRLEDFSSSGLYGIIPPDRPFSSAEVRGEWIKEQRAIEADELGELRVHLAHFNVDLKSFDKARTSPVRREDY